MEKRENIMGTMPIPKLLFQLSLPMVLSVLIQSLYNLVDSIFVGRMGDKALTAISLTAPVSMIMLSVGFGLSIGVNALLSLRLGEKNQDAVDKTAGNGLFLVLAGTAVFMLLGFFAVEPFYRMQTADPEIFTMSVDYTRIIMIFSVGLMVQTLVERLLSATGKTLGSMLILSSGAVINLILDPILIFGYFGLPAMGIRGAAIATVIGQIFGAALGLVLNVMWNKEIRLYIKNLVPDRKLIKEIITIAIPATLTYAISSILTFVLNIILIGFSSVAPAVYIVYSRIQSFIVMPVWGVRNTIVSVIAYNMGANQKQRVRETIRVSLYTAVVIMLIGTLLFESVPTILLDAFSASDVMKEIGIPALRIIGITLVLNGMSVMFSGIFQSMNNSDKAFIGSVVQTAVTIAAAYLLSLTGNLMLVWLAFPIAEICVFLVNLVFYRKLHRETFAEPTIELGQETFNI